MDMACARLDFVVVATDEPADEQAGGERIRVRSWV